MELLEQNAHVHVVWKGEGGRFLLGLEWDKTSPESPSPRDQGAAGTAKDGGEA